MEREIKLAITLLNEILRIDKDVHKNHNYPDSGEPYDENASRLQASILLELVALHINKAQDYYSLYLLKNDLNRRLEKLEDQINEKE